MILNELWYDILEYLFQRQVRSHDVNIGHQVLHISPGDLIRIEADGSYCHLITTDKRHLISRNLKSVENAIQGWGIVRVNRSNIINVAHVVTVKSRKRQIIMSDGHVIRIPRRNKKEMTNFLDNHYRVDVIDRAAVR